MIVRATYPVYVEVEVEVDNKFLPLENDDTWTPQMAWELRDTMDEMMVAGKISVSEVIRSTPDNCLDVGDLQSIVSTGGDLIIE